MLVSELKAMYFLSCQGFNGIVDKKMQCEAANKDADVGQELEVGHKVTLLVDEQIFI